MAKRKKTKTKTKKAKKKSAGKPAARRPVAKKAARKKRPGTKPRAAPKPKKAAPVVTAPPAPAAAPPAGDPIGVVTHYFNHLSVAIIALDGGSVRVGELVRIKGHTSDFTQRVDSMEIDHAPVTEAHPGQSFGLRVKDHAREHDAVYKVVQ